MNIIAILIIAAFLVTSCNSQNNGERATGQTHEHVDGDGHDHENEPGHDHSKGTGMTMPENLRKKGIPMKLASPVNKLKRQVWKRKS